MKRILNPYNDLYMRRVLESAYQGDRKAKKLLNTLNEPFAVAPDYSALIVVVEDRPVLYPDGKSQPDEEGSGDKQRAEIYECREGYTGSESCVSSWTYIPIPIRFTVREVKYEAGTFCFVSVDGNTVAGTLEQIRRTMKQVVSYSNTATEEEIEISFRSIHSTGV
ncbi:MULTISPECIES: hypothetical protein [unclassified Paenibacillus]|uniref:hypothetical protein n=1 Tax=unclassified Paenibacillus TaxID=185978 RepID=UPI00362BFB52